MIRQIQVYRWIAVAMFWSMIVVIGPVFSETATSTTDPAIEEHSDLFKGASDGVGEPGHVFHPMDPETEPPHCPQAVVFRFASGPVIGLCDFGLKQTSANPRRYRVEAGQELDLLTKDAGGENKALPLSDYSGADGNAFEVSAILEPMAVRTILTYLGLPDKLIII